MCIYGCNRYAAFSGWKGVLLVDKHELLGICIEELVLLVSSLLMILTAFMISAWKWVKVPGLYNDYTKNGKRLGIGNPLPLYQILCSFMLWYWPSTEYWNITNTWVSLGIYIYIYISAVVPQCGMFKPCKTVNPSFWLLQLTIWQEGGGISQDVFQNWAGSAVGLVTSKMCPSHMLTGAY